MFRKLKAIKDAFITNRVINNQRVVDANTGEASTLDLFKLYQETRLDGVPVDEISRILIKFDLEPLLPLVSQSIDINDSSFKAFISMKDVYGGQTTPSNFSISVFPLLKKFDEGVGSNISSFSDLSTCNFLTASGFPEVPWSLPGASDPVLDYDASNGAHQFFEKGSEDLFVDVTSIVSSTLAGQIPNEGFRISFSGTQETDTKTRFVKRFASRHITQPSLKPSLEIRFDDSVNDDRANFIFGSTGSLTINSFKDGVSSNIIGVSGSNSLILKLSSGSAGLTYNSGTLIQSGSDCRILSSTTLPLPDTYWEIFVTASQNSIGVHDIPGQYIANFAIDSDLTGALSSHVKANGKAIVKEQWLSTNLQDCYYEGEFEIKTQSVKTGLFPNSVYVKIVNNQGKYNKSEDVNFRVFAQIRRRQRFIASRLPLETKSDVFTNMFYRIVDNNSRCVIVDYSSATKMSNDSQGMYFNINMSDLEPGFVYGIEIKIEEGGNSQFFNVDNLGSTFVIE